MHERPNRRRGPIGILIADFVSLIAGVKASPWRAAGLVLMVAGLCALVAIFVFRVAFFHP